ncbi:MAG: acetate--CoA ligase family protein [Vulcanisaeta sp.]|jgi:acetyl-CoA synthetase (ADP-forming)|nr:MAG: acetyl-CoA synthetase [Vulcanisaeta sp. CIS_19]MCG2865155.1 acetate--CoA ligase family protein [Vulcanisaeta sp.]MCG2866747.1 acetate--CoA ligase family protein [Vulcanisaeta sp.]MCG2885777.1 acetate--CoA ligase family protein [Vulcanisaeta sp.]MDT7863110.1 acetate--CoA ligase family protein [Vulcanisaeta sp.]
MNPIIAKAIEEGRYKLLEHESFELLRQYNIPVPDFALVQDVDEALRVVKDIGYPIVLKVVSPDIVHKSDVGGVILNISNDDELRSACERIRSNIKEKAPYARVSGFLVQKMVPEGLETIVGATKDPIFGHVIAFGLGGVLVEVLQDVSFRIVPVSEEDARAMIREIRGYRLFNGYRNMPARDEEAVVYIITRFSELLSDNPNIVEADLNPIIILERGKGAYAADARFIIGIS